MLSVRGLRSGYPGRPVLRGVDLDVDRGQLVALVGPNGCGKTTLLRAIAGTQPVEAGEMALDGADALRMSATALARRIAVVAQTASLPEGFTAHEIAMMGRTPHLRLLQAEGSRDLRAVRAAMERAGAWDLRGRRVDQLSGGERQRVLIARALAQEPHLLLLDEPTSHLDLAHQLSTFRLVLDLCRRERLAAIAVVHDLTLASLFADRITVMQEGVIAADGAPADVLSDALIARVYGVRVRVLAGDGGRPIVVPHPLADDAPATPALAGEEAS